MGSMCLEDEEMKNIPVCELFYRVVLDTTVPLFETSQGTNTSLSISIITQNGVKQRLWLIMVLKQQQNSWKMM
jgi:hypothetical protein